MKDESLINKVTSGQGEVTQFSLSLEVRVCCYSLALDDGTTFRSKIGKVEPDKTKTTGRGATTGRGVRGE